jgi:hypothetical protein
MNNQFSGLINNSFKQIFNNAIDSLLEKGSLTVDCRLEYDTTKYTICYNCIYDPILDRSSGRYNTITGNIPFADQSICPVCMGIGKKLGETTEVVNIAVILDSKYWLNWGSISTQIPNLAAQTLCKIDLLPKINNATHMVLLENINYDSTKYSKADAPTLMGLGDHNYILTNWTK